MTAPEATPANPPLTAAVLRLWHWLAGLALAALGFFLTFSTAGVALSLGVLLGLALVRPGVVWRAQPWKEPVMGTGLVLLAFIAGHTLWTSGWHWATLQRVNHYQELALAPMLLALLQAERHRRVFLRALIAGSMVLALVHWAAFAVPALGPVLESRRISAGFALAVCAFVALVRARGAARPWPAWLLAAFFSLTVLFAIDGRTGHVVMLALVSCAAWLYSPARLRWVGALAAPAMLLALALSSPAVQNRVTETLQRPPPAARLDSTGIRIEMFRLATDLARRYGVGGVGFANYSKAHEEAARARYGGHPDTRAYLDSSWIRSDNPHNEYLMQLVGGGAVSLVLLLAWMAAALWQAARARPPLGGMLAGATLALAVGCLFNSLLRDFVEGHFYMALLAWLVAENRYGRASLGAGTDTAGVDRILVIATRQIGDVLLTTPLIHAARQRWPQARIEVLGFQGTLGMLRGNPEVNGQIETPARLGWRGAAALARRLWRRYDLALVADAGDRAHLLGWIAAPRRSGIVAPDTASAWWKKLLLDHVVVAAGDLGDRHVIVEKQALLSPWLAAGAAAAPQVVPPTAAALPAQAQAALLPGAVVIHAPSMWPYKQWPIAHFESLVGALLARGRQVVLTGSNSPRDQECVAALRHLAPAPQLLDLSGQLDFNQLVTLLRGAALYIGPDTSVSHLAAACGTPVIAIFGPTHPIRWAPWPAGADTLPGSGTQAQALFARSAAVQQVGNVTLLQGSLPCVPCGRAGCEDHRQSRSDCLVDITPERVLEQALKILG